MPNKNWLIRTKNKQILGPATKDKVIELIEKGSLTADDEIACGNGYWFWVREKDLLEKYLYGDLPQTFNPISEAQDVLTSKTTPDGVTASVTDSPQRAKAKAPAGDDNQLPADDDLAYPDADDLDYPDMGETTPPSAEALQDIPGHEDNQEGEFSEDHNETLELKVDPPKPVVEPPKSNQNPSPVEEDGENFLYPSDKDLEYPDMGEDDADPIDDDQTDPNISIPGVEQAEDSVEEVEELEEDEEIEDLEEAEESEDDDDDDDEDEEPPQEIKPPSPKKRPAKGRKRRVVAERTSNDRYLIYIGVFIVLAIAVVIYYYKAVLNKPLPVIGMQEAQAQTIQSLSKKKISTN